MRLVLLLLFLHHFCLSSRAATLPDPGTSCPALPPFDRSHGIIQIPISDAQPPFFVEHKSTNQKDFVRIARVHGEGEHVEYYQDIQMTLEYHNRYLIMRKLGDESAGTYRVISVSGVCVAAWNLTMSDASTAPAGTSATTVSPVSGAGDDGSTKLVGLWVALGVLAAAAVVLFLVFHFCKKKLWSICRDCCRFPGQATSPSLHGSATEGEEISLPVMKEASEEGAEETAPAAESNGACCREEAMCDVSLRGLLPGVQQRPRCFSA
ncbi:uncharacterized protein LOC115080924 [Rhinatrema bivittatum]|uniref:uncharacterized protein LOC115080924 n=1 Tax=Rhinatrema bivittatum TaxID=194408 RepID=UPI0011288DE8|nr:uncharacterized protein LOC115080924 [Rhinatrema bivittatum]